MIASTSMYLEHSDGVLKFKIDDSSSRPGSIDVQFVDFDGVRFRLSTPQSKEVLILSMNIRCWEELAKYGAEDILRREYGNRVMAQPEADYHVSIEYAIDSIPPPGGKRSSFAQSSGLTNALKILDEREALIKSASLLKRNVLAAPFERAFSTQKTLESSESTDLPGDLMEIRYRDEEAIYVQASQDRVTVVFSTIFKDETDKTFGKVFLQVRYKHPLLQLLNQHSRNS
jgi:actin related protein 2/3 complex, subunit 2